MNSQREIGFGTILVGLLMAAAAQAEPPATSPTDIAPADIGLADRIVEVRESGGELVAYFDEGAEIPNASVIEALMLVTPAHPNDISSGNAPARPMLGGIAIAGGMLFDFDSSVLRPQARAVLDQVCRAFSSPRLREQVLSIEGHADAVGSAAYNDRLSLSRAKQSAQVLGDCLGKERVSVAGFGERQPLAGFESTASQQRRVEIRRARNTPWVSP